jgi:hypothetical protein
MTRDELQKVVIHECSDLTRGNLKWSEQVECSKRIMEAFEAALIAADAAAREEAAKIAEGHITVPWAALDWNYACQQVADDIRARSTPAAATGRDGT